MKDMSIAVERLNQAMGRKERIMVYGDYDVDGTTAVALVYKFLQQFYSNIDYYIPDRYNEGYGVSVKGVDYACETGVKLIIVLDCGIKAVEEIAYAKEKGIDFIICDHNVPDDILPPAVAILNSKRADNTYPYDHLSGCGVGFKFMQAFALNNGIEFHQLTPLLDLVGFLQCCREVLFYEQFHRLFSVLYTSGCVDARTYLEYDINYGNFFF